ncbi:MAG: class I SAM-dependent methyltransferase [Candidatus Absconditabacterales bacterium]|jgi:O-methyltransferase involved in polyketide biosynthesis
MVAYRRTFTDIPYSAEIFEILEKIRKRNDYEAIPSDLKKPELAPQFEARHKLIDKLIYQTHSDQILELASGFSSRGLSMSRENNFHYVELDLPTVVKEKEQIIKEIAKEKGFEVPSNLHFEAGNVLDFKSFETAVKYFDTSKPLIIINEGLLRYLTKDEKAKVAQHIHKILEEFGGVWITSDISLRKIFSKENKVMNDHVKKISKLTGKDIFSNRFETEEEAKKFFEDLGFSIERHRFMEVYDDLISPKRLHLSQQQVKDVVEDAVVYVMRPTDTIIAQ